MVTGTQALTVAKIPWLGERAAADVSLVGGKVAQLSCLCARHPVPPGFCLTTTALSAWPDDECPGELRARIERAHARLCEQLGQLADPWLAVRSSGIDEDGCEASFAGQFETVLGVRGLDALLAAVAHCRASARSDRVRAYRQGRGMERPAPLAVLIQALIPADVSLVAFSINPVTQERAEVVVNASWGLGESIVGGTTTPDTYVIRDSQVVCRTGAKERMTVLGPAGVREVPVPRLLRGRPSLSDAQALEVAALARRLETEQGWPVDLEGAFWEDRLYLLQCRPVTTIQAAC